MRTIYKYPLETTDLQTIKVPKLEYEDEDNFKNQFLYIDVQNGCPYLWCMVDTESKIRNIQLRIVGTGNYMSEFLNKEDYLGSYQLFNGQFVGHVFIEREDC